MIEIRYRSLKELRPYARNSRTHTQTQIAKVRASLAEYGWTNPMLIADGQMIAGHARLSAATQMAEQDDPIPGNPDPWQGPTVDLSHLSKTQRRAYVLADNRLALDAGWDEELLKLELQDLKAEGFDLALTGFDDVEFVALVNGLPPDDDPRQPGALAATFGVPPFTVLNAREGWWQNRKQAWLALGIQSELGRGENLLQFSDTILEPDPEKRRQRAGGAR